jgi:hypothetical protein
LEAKNGLLVCLGGKQKGKRDGDKLVSQTVYFGKNGYVVGVTAEKASLVRKLPSDIGAVFNVLNVNTCPQQIGQLSATADTFFVKKLHGHDSTHKKFEYDWESMADNEKLQESEEGTLIDIALQKMQCQLAHTKTTNEPYTTLYAKDTLFTHVSSLCFLSFHLSILTHVGQHFTHWATLVRTKKGFFYLRRFGYGGICLRRCRSTWSFVA